MTLPTAYTIPVTAGIGHVHLNVADLERALVFYCEVLGFELVTRYAEGPHGAAFVAAGGYHHHIGLNTWRSRNATAAPPGHTGLYHFAVRYANRRDLAVAVQRVLAAGVPLQGATCQRQLEMPMATIRKAHGVGAWGARRGLAPAARPTPKKT